MVVKLVLKRKNENIQIWSRYSLFKNTGCRLPASSSAALTIPSLPTVAARTLTIPSLPTVVASTLTIPSLPGITSWPQPHQYATDCNKIKLQAIWTAKLSQYTIVPRGQYINVESGWMAASIYSTIKQKLASNPNAMLHNRCITHFHSHTFNPLRPSDTYITKLGHHWCR